MCMDECTLKLRKICVSSKNLERRMRIRYRNEKWIGLCNHCCNVHFIILRRGELNLYVTHCPINYLYRLSKFCPAIPLLFYLQEDRQSLHTSLPHCHRFLLLYPTVYFRDEQA